ncbi:MAG: hypothetical protein QNJ62_06185 [Methyloceanibacter sp.]|nr:hypothetical protein [Methyloceanibacter sp.]
MTIKTTKNRITYDGNGATIVFDFPFKFESDTDLRVFTRASDGTETEKVLNTDFIVSGGSGSTGAVTMAQAPTSDEKLTIFREPPITQETALPEGGPFPSKTVEGTLDRLTTICQRLQDQLDRTVRLSETSDPADLINIEALLAAIAAAVAAIDVFNDNYLGPKDSDPTVDNSGNPLEAGDIYFNTVTNTIRVYNGSAWNDITSTTTPPDGSVTDQSISATLDSTQKETFRNRIGAIDTTGVVGNRQIFTNSGTFSKSTLPTTATHVIAHVWGAGGGGGGGNATTNNELRGPGGGGGGYSTKRIAVTALGTTETVTIGGGGGGGSSGTPGSSGATGGSSSFGGHCSATGGNGGAFAGGPGAIGGLGGVGSGGDLNLRGGGGGIGSYAVGTPVGTNVFGVGGDAAGAGGAGGRRNVGEVGEFPGGAGSGANHTNGSFAGAGAGGLVIIEW